MRCGDRTTDLRSLRKLAGLSQYEFARLSAISRGRISLVECGNSRLNDEEQARAERVLRAAIAERFRSVKWIVECSPEPHGGICNQGR
jgi:transcriptional regulator with XRE-family HTH domain